jgi:hypothetical protein
VWQEEKRKYFSETSVEFQRTTVRYIPEDNSLNNHCCETLKSIKSYNIYRSSYTYTDLVHINIFLTRPLLIVSLFMMDLRHTQIYLNDILWLFRT